MFEDGEKLMVASLELVYVQLSFKDEKKDDYPSRTKKDN